MIGTNWEMTIEKYPTRFVVLRQSRPALARGQNYAILASQFTLLFFFVSKEIRPHRLSVRTPGFHPGKRGSTPLGATNKLKSPENKSRDFLVYSAQGEEKGILKSQLPGF